MQWKEFPFAMVIARQIKVNSNDNNSEFYLRGYSNKAQQRRGNKAR